MSQPRLHRHMIVPVFLLAVAALSAVVWRYGYLQALGQLSSRGISDLALASDRLSAQLQVYRELAVLMADHPALSRLQTAGERAEAQALLLGVADKTGALDIFFADGAGRVIVSSTGGTNGKVGGDPALRRAMQGALGSDHWFREGDNRRIYTHAAPVFAETGKVRGTLVVVSDVEQIETDWRGDRPAVFFTDDAGEVFLTNRSELLFWTRRGDGVGLAPLDGPAPSFSAGQTGPHEIWRLDWGPYVPRRALHLARDLPVIGLRGEALVDTAPARRLAGLQAAAVAAICLAFGALLFLATERRRALAEANVELERRVARRTSALSAANTALRREVAEREEAEAALKRAQDDLVQAGKLSALGQMSAGISHELNQPLMAIRSFAENGALYMERGRSDKAAENLSRISDMARRMGRIIRNLRAFSRQESEPAGRVDVVAVVDSAIELTGARLRRDGIELRFERPLAPIWVRGGEVRLGQVFVNLIANAADAMAGARQRRLDISIAAAPVPAVSFRDHGPGLAAPDKVFEPFYTTKEVGASEGMGLGLSISYGIIQSFGGEIRGGNAPGGGAEFTVRLEPWVEEEAA